MIAPAPWAATRLLGFLAFACGAALLPRAAEAAIACSVSSAGITAVYVSSAASAYSSAASITMQCVRGAGDPASVSYSLASSNGLYPTGNSNRAQLSGGSSRITYELYRDAVFASRWGPQNGQSFSGTFNFGTALSASMSIPYYFQIAASQIVPAGTYLDTVAMTLTYGATTAVSSFAVQIGTLSTCQISTLPGSVVFNYTSFQPSPASASTSFAVKCTSGLPYTMQLDATSGNLLGLQYSLALSATGTQVGTGIAQNASVNGAIAAGQSGTCGTGSCSATQTRTLTITY